MEAPGRKWRSRTAVESQSFDQLDAFVARLRAHLDRQHDDLTELSRLAAEQRSLIDPSRLDELMALLERRRAIVERLLSHERAGASMGERWERVRGQVGAREREEIDRRVQALSELAGTVCRRDASDQEELASLRDDAAKSIAGVSRGRSAIGAYGRSDVGGARFQDREG